MSTDLIEEYIASGNGPGIQDLLHSNPRLAEQRTSQGMSPLLLACYYNKPTLARIFAKKDPHYLATSESASEDDRRLESTFSGFDRKVDMVVWG